MPFDLAQALRMKGMIDRALRDAPDSVTGAPGLTQAYMNARNVCLGLVSDIMASDGKVIFSITVPAEQAEKLEPMRQAAERVVSELPGVEKAMVALTAARQAGAPRPAPSPVRGAPRAELAGRLEVVVMLEGGDGLRDHGGRGGQGRGRGAPPRG